MKTISVLIPTKDRPVALVATLTSLLYQTYKNFEIFISDQGSIYTIANIPTFQTLRRIFREKNVHLTCTKHIPERGMAEQRQFMLEHSSSPYSLFLDDDVILEDYAIEGMIQVIQKEKCGFVGRGLIGLSYKNDVRPNEQKIEFWRGKVKPEKILPQKKKWMRYKIHNAANIYHVQKQFKITSKAPKEYKVAWVGGCVLYDTQKLHDVGGFTFWKNIPKEHVGEDVLAQLRVMEKYGGCGILPSGAYHQELPTTIPNRKINAPEYVMTHRI